MKLPDTDLLVHAVNRDSPAHTQAMGWLTEAFDSSQGVGLAWVALLGFIRISARGAAFWPASWRLSRRSRCG